MIKVESLTKKFSNGVTALNQVSFSVESGEAVAVIGPSGAGKTTLFKALTRSISLDGGGIEISGIDLYGLAYAKLKMLQNRIGVIYQQHNLVKELSVSSNVVAGLLGSLSTFAVIQLLLMGPSPSMSKRITACLDELGMGDRMSSRAGNLSGGEQQRVAVARLFMQDPEIILADEPISSVDPVSAERIMDALITASKHRRKTLICNIHNVDVACKYFNRVIALRKGEIIFDGSPAQIDSELLSTIYSDDRQNGSLKKTLKNQENSNKTCDCLELTASVPTQCEQKGSCR